MNERDRQDLKQPTIYSYQRKLSPIELGEKSPEIQCDYKKGSGFVQSSNTQLMIYPNIELMIYPVARYSTTPTTPLLSLPLQQRLDAMSPREYLPFVLNELSLDERESLLIDEGQRRKTFQANWPHYGQLSGKKMAQAGFYSLGDTDRVQCVFCRGRLHSWSENDIPLTEHARAFNFCRFVKELECRNREYTSAPLHLHDVDNIIPFPTAQESERCVSSFNLYTGRDQSLNYDARALGICTNRAARMTYAPDPARLRTYTRWPRRHPVTAEQLCDAGFYYTGFDDQVRCFFCSGGLREWAGGDDPWEEHARWFPDCSFLLKRKGEDFVQKVYSITPSNKKCKKPPKKVQVPTMQEEMIRICRRLGHTDAEICGALDRNGGSFNKIDELIEAVYSLKEDQLVESEKSLATRKPELPALYGKVQQTPLQETIQPPESKETASSLACCKLCERRKIHSVSARYVGLPCGHLIYCEECCAKELRKSTTQQPRCPYPQCDAPLAGTIRINFAYTSSAT